MAVKSKSFVSRLEEFDSFPVIGVQSPLLGELEEADRAVQAKLEELDEACGVSALSPEKLGELGQRFAKGELKPETVAARISSAATVPRGQAGSRHAVVRQAAKAQLRAELDRPEWSRKSLLESFREPVAKVVDQAAVEMVETWQALPEHLKDFAKGMRGPGKLGRLANEVDLNALSGAEIDQVRRLSQVWVFWSPRSVPPLVYVAEQLGELPSQYTASGRANPNAPAPLQHSLLWSGAEEAAVLALDDLVIGGHVDALEPVIDGSSEEYAERKAFMDKIDTWKHEKAILTAARANVPLGSDRAAEWNRRRDLEGMQLLEEFRSKPMLVL
ncbi:hypothetical protein ACXZ66_02000 [Corynebacterium sp. S7]